MDEHIPFIKRTANPNRTNLERPRDPILTEVEIKAMLGVDDLDDIAPEVFAKLNRVELAQLLSATNTLGMTDLFNKLVEAYKISKMPVES